MGSVVAQAVERHLDQTAAAGADHERLCRIFSLSCRVAGRAALVISKYELWRFRLVGSGCIRADVSLHDTQDLKAKLSKFLELPRRRVREVLGIHLRPSGRVVGEWTSFNQFRAELVMSVHCSLSVKRRVAEGMLALLPPVGQT